MKKFNLLLTLLILGAVLAACSSPNQEAAPASTDPGEVQRGQEIYQESCSSCHGPNREGLSGPSLLPAELDQGRSTYFNIIENGSGAMPAWGDTYSESEINAVIDYLFSSPQ